MWASQFDDEHQSGSAAQNPLTQTGPSPRTPGIHPTGCWSARRAGRPAHGVTPARRHEGHMRFAVPGTGQPDFIAPPTPAGPATASTSPVVLLRPARSGLSIAPTCIRFIPLSNSDGPRNVGNCSPASIDIEAPARNIDPSAIVYENRTTANPNVTLHRRVVTPRRQGPAVPYDHSRPKRSSIS